MKRIFGAFTKVEEQADGSLYVEGIASSEARDSQGEVVKASAMEAALPDYLRFPTIREMHTAWAAGKTLSAVVEGGQTHIAAKIVDAEAITKVREGVYGGFSIGGNVPVGGRSKNDPKTIERINLVEISLVDRPANPDAVFQLVKLDALQEEAPVAKQTKAIESKAAGAVADPAPPQATIAPAAAESAPAPVEKGMFQVKWAAELLEQLAALQASTAYEASYEGDNSPVPGKAKQLVADLAALLRDLVAEETAEIVAGAEAVAPTVVAAAEPAPTTTKADAPPPVATTPAAPPPAAPVEKAAEPLSDDQVKAITALIEKMIAPPAPVEKVVAVDELRKVTEERDAIAGRLAAAEAQIAATPKGVLKAISKAEDSGGLIPQDEDTSKISDPVERAKAEIKKLYRAGPVSRQ